MSTTVVVEVSAQRLWSVVSDFEGVVRAMGGEAKASGSQVGDRRHVGPGGAIVEVLEERDDDAYTLTYAAVEPGPSRMVGYRSRMTVTAQGADRALLTWTGTFAVAEGSDEDRVVRGVTRTYAVGAEALLATLAAAE